MQCLKFQRSTSLGCKKIGVAHFFLQKMLCIIPEFFSQDATVACRWLGFGGGSPTTNSFFGPESNYIMDDVMCTGAVCRKRVDIYLALDYNLINKDVFFFFGGGRIFSEIRKRLDGNENKFMTHNQNSSPSIFGTKTRKPKIK